MPEQIDDLWHCKYCGKTYTRMLYAVNCENSHDIVYVPLSRSDIFKLLQFLYTKDETLLTESLMKTLLKYRKNF